MRLIDGDKMVEHLDLCLAESDSSTLIVDATLAAIKYYVENAPTVDAVEVVRCGDCIYCEKAYLYSTAEVDKNDKCCALNERLTNDDYFCPYGERR